jgi:hypothetical protein
MKPLLYTVKYSTRNILLRAWILSGDHPDPNKQLQMYVNKFSRLHTTAAVYIGNLAVNFVLSPDVYLSV